MLPDIQNVQSSGTASYANKAQANLGRDDFLKIFLTQLQYQDPLNPMEGTEFTAQLAQFSSLEQLFNINDQLKELEKIQGKDSKFQALNLIDKLVRADGNKLSLKQDGDVQGAFDLKAPADCMVLIEDGSGNQVRTIPMGILDAGLHSFSWDGRNDQGARLNEGIYHFKVIAKDSAGEAVSTQSMILGKVTGVNFQGESPVIYIGDIELDLSQVMDVKVMQNHSDESSSVNQGET